MTDKNKKPAAMPAMDALKGKRFFQRMWTRMERDRNGDGRPDRVLVGTAPAHVPVRMQDERLTPGPERGRSMMGSAAAKAKNALLQENFARNDMRFINGEELKPPCDPELYGGEVVRGGPRPGHADMAGQVAPDDVSQSVALGNQYASFQWIKVASGFGFADVEKYKREFNEKVKDDINSQAHNWR
ncbi:effector protein Tle3 domain-containing protein, partial [Ralstonia solanacearum]|uniref:effector protein Tle3 domain-containing protein n=1 Tax=Ralstonia solanacearum TaxID=305 RepID=UPI002E1EF0A7